MFDISQLPERFRKKIRVNPETECWGWTGAVPHGLAGNGGGGYARYRYDGKTGLAHRFAYRCLVGPIDDGMTIDHLCRVRRCVNPDHMETVTQRENTIRGTSVVAVNAHKVHCVRGHGFFPENTRIRRTGGRKCRACTREDVHNYYRRHLESMREKARRYQARKRAAQREQNT